jgi:hypothetical protein
MTRILSFTATALSLSCPAFAHSGDHHSFEISHFADHMINLSPVALVLALAAALIFRQGKAKS